VLECSGWNIGLNVPVGTYLTFYRNTVEISENSENHLKAIVGRRQGTEKDGFSASVLKVVRKTQGEGKALGSGERAGTRRWRVLIK
jgi:hypothetical protein